jgi:hypothetical protein
MLHVGFRLILCLDAPLIADEEGNVLADLQGSELSTLSHPVLC